MSEQEPVDRIISAVDDGLSLLQTLATELRAQREQLAGRPASEIGQSCEALVDRLVLHAVDTRHAIKAVLGE